VEKANNLELCKDGVHSCGQVFVLSCHVIGHCADLVVQFCVEGTSLVEKSFGRTAQICPKSVVSALGVGEQRGQMAPKSGPDAVIGPLDSLVVLENLILVNSIK
jgi:hypothetical protein